MQSFKQDTKPGPPFKVCLWKVTQHILKHQSKSYVLRCSFLRAHSRHEAGDNLVHPCMTVTKVQIIIQGWVPAPELVTHIPLSTSTRLADINGEIKGIIKLIPRQISETGQTCHSLKALLCNDSERSLYRHLKLGETIPTQGD